MPYAGWEMPLNYPHGVIAEHNHVRNAAGLCDVAHMLQFTYDTFSLSIIWYYSVLYGIVLFGTFLFFKLLRLD